MKILILENYRKKSVNRAYIVPDEVDSRMLLKFMRAQGDLWDRANAYPLSARLGIRDGKLVEVDMHLWEDK